MKYIQEFSFDINKQQRSKILERLWCRDNEKNGIGCYRYLNMRTTKVFVEK